MKIEVRSDYTYESMPEYCEEVDGARELIATKEDIFVHYFPDVIYSHKDGVDLRLQILVPDTFNQPDKQYPCLVFIKGSAWFQQEIHRDVVNLGRLAARGYVCAIVEYRHSGIAKFPAQIIDAKNAIRFMRTHAAEYKVIPDLIFVMGDSSGGHCSMMTGMTAKSGKFDEPINDVSCEVRGIINLYGAADILKPDGFPTTENHQLPDSPEGMLIGADLREYPDKGEPAVVKNYVTEDFPPVLILHGTKDKIVFCQQSVELYDALRNAGKEVTLYLVKGADHGGPAFWQDQTIDVYDTFIKSCME